MKILKADDFVDYWLDRSNNELADKFSADVMILVSPLRWGVDDFIRDEVEKINDRDAGKNRDKLVVILQTEGGFIEIVERIYTVFRHHYSHVSFIIPNYAYSAGTVLVLSGDEIMLDYYSVLGPIDPQVENEDGHFVPGMGYLHKFKELVDAINADQAGDNTKAELAYLVRRFDPARLFYIEQARDHSKALLVEWLPKHKFKNWTETKTSKSPVDDAMRRRRAEQIAELLGEPKRWHSHGRGIGIKELTSDELKLEITNFGDDTDLASKIRGYYELFLDYCKKQGIPAAVHSAKGLRRM